MLQLCLITVFFFLCSQESRRDCQHDVCHELFDGCLYLKYLAALSDSMNNKRNSTKTRFPIHASALSVIERMPSRLTHHTCIYAMKCWVCSSLLSSWFTERALSLMELALKNQGIRNCCCRHMALKSRNSRTCRRCQRSWGLSTHALCNKDAQFLFSLMKKEFRFQEWWPCLL